MKKVSKEELKELQKKTEKKKKQQEPVKK